MGYRDDLRNIEDVLDERESPNAHDPTPTTEMPEALALADALLALPTTTEHGGPRWPSDVRREFSALIAQHTAGLTARIRELTKQLNEADADAQDERIELADAAGLGFESEPTAEEAYEAIRDKFAHLEAQLTASAQREAAARERSVALELDLIQIRDLLPSYWEHETGFGGEAMLAVKRKLDAAQQREVSARAEAREAALREALAAIENTPLLPADGIRAEDAIKKRIAAHQPAAGTEGSDE